ncbi:hypothetical protein CC86DRAFT_381033 [Ophiobolus disseminans]|uniref:Uncharacterized protein n=1 Tax=Ophiobolus disseminans TaxID=1469910 RepID=A0A6A7A448_9PLEO|nr:hypothetical protein CC86DRAFT_381033 [Ophiobolus disseminans]
MRLRDSSSLRDTASAKHTISPERGSLPRGTRDIEIRLLPYATLMSVTPRLERARSMGTSTTKSDSCRMTITLARAPKNIIHTEKTTRIMTTRLVRHPHFSRLGRHAPNTSMRESETMGNGEDDTASDPRKPLNARTDCLARAKQTLSLSASPLSPAAPLAITLLACENTHSTGPHLATKAHRLAQPLPTKAQPASSPQAMDKAMPDAPHHTPTRTAERASQVREMKQWAENLRLGVPIPRDLLPLLAKDDAKQMEIVLRNLRLGTEGGGT